MQISLELALSGTKDQMFVLRGRRSVSSWAPYPSAVLTSEPTLLGEVTDSTSYLAHRGPGLQLLKRNNANLLVAPASLLVGTESFFIVVLAM